VRSPHSEAPTIYLYEAVPGGIGLSERLFKRHDELVIGARALIEACPCQSGCPACTGPRLDPTVDGKALALRLLAALLPARGIASSVAPGAALEQVPA
jgi:DEAD/DEAH box helicase domain-containing protein